MRHVLSNLWYFGSRLFGFGLLFGLLFGSFTYPAVGSAVGTVWGGIAGLVLGLVTGIGMTIYNRFVMKPETDFRTYQKNLSYSFGLAALVAMAIPLLIVYAPIAAVTAAYVAHRYAEQQIPNEEKRKNEDRTMLRNGVIAQMVSRTITKAPIFIGLASIGAMIFRWWNLTHTPWISPTATEVFMQTIVLGIGIIIYGFILAAAIGLTNGIFTHFANHLYFSPHTPKAEYKRLVVPGVMVLTLLMTTIAAGFFGAPLAAIVAGWGANSYVDWYYEGQEKRKRDAQTNRLEDGREQHAEDNFAYAEEEYLWNEVD